jgi:hypothetical protein
LTTVGIGGAANRDEADGRIDGRFVIALRLVAHKHYPLRAGTTDLRYSRDARFAPESDIERL